MDRCFACESRRIRKQVLDDTLEILDEAVLFVKVEVVTCEDCHCAIVGEAGMTARMEAMAWYYRMRGVPEETIEKALLLPQDTRMQAPLAQR